MAEHVLGEVDKLDQRGMRKFSYLWTIKNFTACGKSTGLCLESPKFFSIDCDNVSYNLRLYPNGESDENKNFLTIYTDAYVTNSAFRPIGHDYKLKFSLIDINMKERFIKEENFPVVSENMSAGIFKYLSNDVLSEMAHDLLPGGALTIFCEVTFRGNVSLNKPNGQTKTPENQLAADLARLLQSHNLSNVILITKEKEFFVHKAILAARSDVFLAMFEHEMEENMQNKVEIEDVEDEVLQEMLRFIYTGIVNFIDENLFIAADKYLLYELKKMCEESLCLTLNIENVVNRLMLADRHTGKELKCHAIDFLNSHPDEVMKTDGWMTLVDKHPRLISESLSAVSKNKADVGESFIMSSREWNQKYVYTTSRDFSETRSGENEFQLKLPTHRIAKPYTCWSYTWLKATSHEDILSYEWKVVASNLSPNTSEKCFKSLAFWSRKNEKIKWHLQLIHKLGTHYSIMLVLDSAEFEVNAKFKMTFLGIGCNSSQGVSLEGEKVFQKNTQYWESENEIWFKSASRTIDLHGVISYITTDTVSISVQQKADDVVTNPVCSLPNNLHSLLERQTMTDVTLMVKDREIPAHKAILAARSSVFSDTLKCNFKENKLDIADMDYEVFQEMLRFIYTGDVSPNFNMERMCLDLLDAAYKYALEGLKAICERFLSTNLTIENSADALILSDRHQVVQLKVICFDFIQNHLEEVLKTEGWERLVQNHVHLLIDVYKTVVEELIPYPQRHC